MGQFAGRSVPVIVTAPFFEAGKSLLGPIHDDKFQNKDAAKLAREETLRTGFHMLAQGVCNFDQDQNILYDKSTGRTLFIDLGMAVTISHDLRSMSHSQAWAAWAPKSDYMDTSHWQEPKASIAAFLRILLEKSGRLSLHEVYMIWDKAWPQELQSSLLYQAASELFEQYHMVFASREGNVNLVRERLERMQQRLQDGSHYDEVSRQWDAEVKSLSIAVAKSQENKDLLRLLQPDISLVDAVEVLDEATAIEAIDLAGCSDLGNAVYTLSEKLEDSANSLEKIESILKPLLTTGKEKNCQENDFMDSDTVQQIFFVVNMIKSPDDDVHLKHLIEALLPYADRVKNDKGFDKIVHTLQGKLQASS